MCKFGISTTTSEYLKFRCRIMVHLLLSLKYIATKDYPLTSFPLNEALSTLLQRKASTAKNVLSVLNAVATGMAAACKALKNAEERNTGWQPI